MSEARLPAEETNDGKDRVGENPRKKDTLYYPHGQVKTRWLASVFDIMHGIDGILNGVLTS